VRRLGRWELVQVVERRAVSYSWFCSSAVTWPRHQSRCHSNHRRERTRTVRVAERYTSTVDEPHLDDPAGSAAYGAGYAIARSDD
jgi:hypothetical protein